MVHNGGGGENYSTDYNDRTGGLLNLPGSHGLEDDQSPLGTGTALLLGLGAAYLATKKRKNQKNPKHHNSKFFLIAAALTAGLISAQPIMACGQSRTYEQLYSADFTSVENHSYTQNKTFTLNTKSWTSSVSQVASSVFYLGYNKSGDWNKLGLNDTFSDIDAALTSVDENYTSETHTAYALRFDNAYNDVTKVVFNWNGGNVTAYVYLFGYTGSSYTLLNSADYSSYGASTGGSVEWTGTATNYTKFAIAVRPYGTNGAGITSYKTLRAASFYIYKNAGPTQLDAPTNFSATPGNEQANFTWDAVTNASSYTISYTPTNGTEQTATGITGTSYTITSLTNNVAYTCKIKAVGDGTTYSDSEYTSTITVTPTGATLFNVTVTSPITGGTVTAEPTTAAANATITLTAAPAAGYTFNNVVANWSITPVSTTINPVANTNTATFSMPAENVTAVSATFTPIAVTLNAGNGTVGGTATTTWNVTLNGGNLPNAEAPCNKWSFEGWSTSAVAPETTTRPTTFVSTAYVPTEATTLYAVYKKVEEVSFDNTQGGDFKIYAAITSNNTTTNYYATGSVSNGKISSTTTAANATTYTLEKPDNTYDSGEYAIKYVVNNTTTYLTYNSSTNLGTSTDPYKWTVSSSTAGAGTWRVTSGTSGRALIFSGGAEKFGGYSTGNVPEDNQHNLYYDVEIGGGSATYYCSTADCTEPLVAPTITLSSGTYTEVKTTTITYDNPNATIRYTIGTNPADPTSTTGTVYTLGTNIEINESCVLKAKAFLGEQESPVATASYTINLPQVFATISDFKAAFSATSTEEVTITGPLTVVYQNGISIYVQDATGGLLIYDEEDNVTGTYTNGKTVSDIKGKYKKYNGLVEFVPTEDLPTPGTGTAVEPVDITSLTASNYATYESRLVRLTNAEFTADGTLSTSSATNVNMEDANGNTVVLRNGFKTLAGSIADGDVANVTGFATAYNNNYQLFPRDNNDVQYILETQEITSSKTIDFDAIVADNEILGIASNGVLTVKGTFTNEGDILIEDGGELVVNNSVEAVVYKTIDDWNTTSWYFIASPLATSTNPTSVSDMITDTYTGEDDSQRTYDLYSLDVTQSTNWWQNYRKHQSDFSLVNGMGYLYASKAGTDLVFSGNIQPSNENVTLNNLNDGFNLLGNPYTCTAYVNQPHYTLSQASDGITGSTVATPKTTAIAPLTGVIINGNSATFSKNVPDGSANNGNIQIVLAQTVNTRGNAGSATIDNAIVSFNEGSQLEKFYFGEQNANIYIPQGNEEYAIVSAEAQGEMPVCFKAKADGQYTISVDAENVEMGYLHLIDNITGADVDLLANPSYTFNAKWDDYASRFRLVFSANNSNNAEAESDNFAFISNGQIILNGVNNNATLQVIDMMGRIVSSEQINGNSANLAPTASGVYVLRLINGTETKTQKIVVK